MISRLSLNIINFTLWTCMSIYRKYLETNQRIARNAPSKNENVFVLGKDGDVRGLRNRKDSQIFTYSWRNSSIKIQFLNLFHNFLSIISNCTKNCRKGLFEIAQPVLEGTYSWIKNQLDICKLTDSHSLKIVRKSEISILLLDYSLLDLFWWQIDDQILSNPYLSNFGIQQ